MSTPSDPLRKGHLALRRSKRHLKSLGVPLWSRIGPLSGILKPPPSCHQASNGPSGAFLQVRWPSRTRRSDSHSPSDPTLQGEGRLSYVVQLWVPYDDLLLFETCNHPLYLGFVHAQLGCPFEVQCRLVPSSKLPESCTPEQIGGSEVRVESHGGVKIVNGLAELAGADVDSSPVVVGGGQLGNLF